MRRSIHISAEAHQVAKALAEAAGMKIYRLIERAILDYRARQESEPQRAASKTKAG